MKMWQYVRQNYFEKRLLCGNILFTLDLSLIVKFMQRHPWKGKSRRPEACDLRIMLMIAMQAAYCLGLKSVLQNQQLNISKGFLLTKYHCLPGWSRHASFLLFFIESPHLPQEHIQVLGFGYDYNNGYFTWKKYDKDFVQWAYHGLSPLPCFAGDEDIDSVT